MYKIVLNCSLRYVEKSQSLLEQRNEGFITSASQSQAKVLALEQEKVCTYHWVKCGQGLL